MSDRIGDSNPLRLLPCLTLGKVSYHDRNDEETLVILQIGKRREKKLRAI